MGNTVQICAACLCRPAGSPLTLKTVFSRRAVSTTNRTNSNLSYLFAPYPFFTEYLQFFTNHHRWLS